MQKTERPSLPLLILAVTIAMAATMLAAWLTQRRLGNGGWADVFWSLGIAVAGTIAALIPVLNQPLPWPTPRADLVAILAALWGGRLGLYLLRRTAQATREDVRYARFRKEWGAQFQPRLLWLLMIQAAVGALLATTILIAAHNPTPGLHLQDAIAITVLVASVAGESLADHQMHLFRANPANKGGVCTTGLWSWSRHPNYFFESTAWLAYPIFAIAPHYPAGYATILAPIAMIWLLTKVSGVPPLEREMLEDRGEAFRAYQQKVSAFWPWPPKK